MSARNVCSECIWNTQKLPYCVDTQNQGYKTCNRFNPTKKRDPNHCGHCDRDKDPGKCWWCEQVDA